MSDNYNVGASDFAGYLQSAVKLDALDKMTQDLDNELADSQRIMREIKTMYDFIPKMHTQKSEPRNTGLRHEDLSQFLEAGMPKLLLPDMIESTMDIDLDNVIATMKGYTEDLKKNFVLTQPQPKLSKGMEKIELEQYASSLQQLSKRLANIKLKTNERNNRNVELEVKLSQLCQDVTMFTQMVQAKTTLSECNKNLTPIEQNNSALYYDSIINKLLSGINEVTYLLQNKN